MSRQKARTVVLAIVLVVPGVRPSVEAASGVAGIRWSVPAGWTELPARPMRVATYRAASAKSPDPVECGVFYFGEGRGGGVDENIQRWVDQFEKSPAPKRSIRNVRGLRVHVAEISGTYLSPAGPMMQSQGKKPGWRLLGAVVQGPEGLVFFKMTGPAAGIAAAERQFGSLIESVTPAASRA